MSPSLPDLASLTLKLSTQCGWGRCDVPKEPGGKYCALHEARQRGYESKSHKRRRDKAKADGRCRDCGDKLPKRWHSTRCKNCQGVQAETAKSRRIKDVARRVKNAPSPPTLIARRETDGYERERDRGRARRGAPSRDQLNDEIRHDFREAKALLERFERSFETACAAGVFGLGKVQRDEALRVVAEIGARGVRLVSALVLALDVDADLEVTAESSAAYRGGRSHAGLK
jgi:hypothetical protein